MLRISKRRLHLQANKSVHPTLLNETSKSLLRVRNVVVNGRWGRCATKHSHAKYRLEMKSRLPRYCRDAFNSRSVRRPPFPALLCVLRFCSWSTDCRSAPLLLHDATSVHITLLVYQELFFKVRVLRSLDFFKD